MDSRKMVWKQTALIAVGQVICVAAMIGIYALLGKFNMEVLWGGLIGSVLTILNFFFMTIGALMAADKAQDNKVSAGQVTIRISMLVRLAVLAVALIAFAKSGLCDVLALVLPLAFTRPILMLVGFFGKAGGSKK